MSLAEALAVHVALGAAAGLPHDIVSGIDSHAPKWHACSIVDHVSWVTAIASALVAHNTAPPELVTCAIWHDIGKVVAPQRSHVGPTFHHHAPTGAVYLAESGWFDPQVVLAVAEHGAYRERGGYRSDAGQLLPLVDLCDELGKWSVEHFPPQGGDKQRRRRAETLCLIADAGVSRDTINLAVTIATRLVRPSTASRASSL